MLESGRTRYVVEKPTLPSTRCYSFVLFMFVGFGRSSIRVYMVKRDFLAKNRNRMF